MPILTKYIPNRLKLLAKEIQSRMGLFCYCPICRNYSRSFLEHGEVPRPNAACMHCSSLERHRMAWVFFLKHTNLLDGTPKRMLHVAPELTIEERLQHISSIDYLTADLVPHRAMEQMDITDIHHPDESFDVVYCSHVLEHVADDRKAMREFHRVLTSTGWAVILVPIKGDTTFEDPSVTTPEDRERVFGQHDHVRIYGPDFKDRLEEAGFRVQCIPGHQVVGSGNVRRMGVLNDEMLFYCAKD